MVPLSAPGALPIVALVVLGATFGVSALVGIVAEIAKYTYIEKLARRIPDLRLAGRARFVRRANYVLIGGGVVLGAVLAVMVVSAGPGTLAATFAGPPPAPTAASSPSSLPSATITTALVAIVAVGGVGVCGLGMIMLVIGVASLVLLFGLRKALQAQAELARHHWAPESVAATPAQ